MAPRDLDKELEALRRLPGNKSCPSCSASVQFGFRDVCVKFAILVCSDCKAAHQARRFAPLGAKRARMRQLAFALTPSSLAALVPALARSSAARSRVAASGAGVLSPVQVAGHEHV